MRHMLFACLLLTVVPISANPRELFKSEDVTITNGSITLAGTLTIPAGPGPFRATVPLSGRGPQSRHSELVGFRPLKILAEYLALQGIAVLRCALLQRCPELDRLQVGLTGHSERATSAVIAAPKSTVVGVIVWMAGFAVAGAEMLQAQTDTLTRAGGATREMVDNIVRKYAALLDAVDRLLPEPLGLVSSDNWMAFAVATRLVMPLRSSARRSA
jgi:hypothetical protein